MSAALPARLPGRLARELSSIALITKKPSLTGVKFEGCRIGFFGNQLLSKNIQIAHIECRKK